MYLNMHWISSSGKLISPVSSHRTWLGAARLLLTALRFLEDVILPYLAHPTNLRRAKQVILILEPLARHTTCFAMLCNSKLKSHCQACLGAMSVSPCTALDFGHKPLPWPGFDHHRIHQEQYKIRLTRDLEVRHSVGATAVAGG